MATAVAWAIGSVSVTLAGTGKQWERSEHTTLCGKGRSGSTQIDAGVTSSAEACQAVCWADANCTG